VCVSVCFISAVRLQLVAVHRGIPLHVYSTVSYCIVIIIIITVVSSMNYVTVCRVRPVGWLGTG
jgi:hypothetical protein